MFKILLKKRYFYTKIFCHHSITKSKKVKHDFLINCNANFTSKIPKEVLLYWCKCDYSFLFAGCLCLLSSGFVLVIQEKDLVQLKIVKQQYRRTVKKANELKNKVDGYRVSY